MKKSDGKKSVPVVNSKTKVVKSVVNKEKPIVNSNVNKRSVKVTKVSKKPAKLPKLPICSKCVEVHKRDTEKPVQCPYCNKIIGCFWHPTGLHKHLSNCKNKQKPGVKQKIDTVKQPESASEEPFRPIPRFVGRPPKYKTVAELEALIDAYFLSCWAQKLDMFGNPIYLKDEKKKKTKIPVMVQVKPYTVTNLALAIGTTRETLLDYEKKDDFSDTIKRAKQMCQGYAEDALFIGKNPTGAIFNLKNNFGFKDKIETEHSGGVTWREELPK